jgi:hypothetical protein
LISNFSLILAAMRYQLIWRTAQVHNRPKSLSALPCRSPPERRRRPPSPSLAALSHPLPLRPPLLPVAVEAPIPSKDGAGEGLHGSVAREAMGCMLGTSGRHGHGGRVLMHSGDRRWGVGGTWQSSSDDVSALTVRSMPNLGPVGPNRRMRTLALATPASVYLAAFFYVVGPTWVIGRGGC